MRQKSPNGNRFVRVGSSHLEVGRKLQKVKALQLEPIGVKKALKDQLVAYKLRYQSVTFPDHQYWLYYTPQIQLLGEFTISKKYGFFKLRTAMNSNDLGRVRKVEAVVRELFAKRSS